MCVCMNDKIHAHTELYHLREAKQVEAGGTCTHVSRYARGATHSLCRMWRLCRWFSAISSCTNQHITVSSGKWLSSVTSSALPYGGRG